MVTRCKNRILKLQEELVKSDIDVAMIYDRENLIYFTGLYELEGACLVVPSFGESKLIILSFDSMYAQENGGVQNIVTYNFPRENVSIKAAEELKSFKFSKARVGFTRYFISLKDFQMLEKLNPDIIFCDIAEICYRIRSIKDELEIRYIKKASEFVKIGMKKAAEIIKSGLTERQVLAEAEYAMNTAGSQGASFRMQVLTPKRQMLIHPYAGDSVIENDQAIVVHLGSSYKGYTAKMCRTLFLGNPPDETIKIYNILDRIQRKLINYIKPNTKSSEVYDLCYELIRKEGYEQYFIMEHLGYGVGIRQSEFYPIIGKGIGHILEENMVIDLLLPTIYKPQFGGPRITDTILISNEECINLTSIE